MGLHDIQTKVQVAKDKRNDFGGYNYRTAEGILAAVKSHLPEGSSIVLTDELIDCGGQIFIKATARIAFADGGSSSADGFAMHPLTKKGMDPSQITGSASSYARKCALSGLFAIDDGSVDPDASEKPYEKDEPKPEPRDPRKIADSLISAAKKATNYGHINEIIGAEKFDAAWKWLEENATPMSLEVKKAVTEMRNKYDPSGQGPHDRGAG